MSLFSDDGEESDHKKKVVQYSDWMVNDDDSSSHHGDPNSDYSDAFDKEQYEGRKGHLLLQLQKSYKGDDRFQLGVSRDFDVDTVAKKRFLPQSMLGNLSKREEELLKDDGETNVKVSLIILAYFFCLEEAQA